MPFKQVKMVCLELSKFYCFMSPLLFKEFAYCVVYGLKCKIKVRQNGLKLDLESCYVL